MSKETIQEELGQYVDWVSLEYYDKRVKEYVDSRCTEDLKIGGDKHSSWFDFDPTTENLNHLYRVTNDFVTGDAFFETGVSCGAGSVIYADNTKLGLKYKLLVNIPVIDISIEEDVSDLSSSLEQLTEKVSSIEKAQEADKNQSILLENELNNLRNRVVKLEDDIEDAETRISEVVDDLRATEHSIHDQLHSHEQRINLFGSSFATKSELERAISDLEGKIGNSGSPVDLSDYATKKFVTDAIDNLDVRSLETRLNTVETQTVTNTNNIVRLETEIESATSSIETLGASVTEMSTNVTNLQSNITDVSTQVSNLESNVVNNYLMKGEGVSQEDLKTEVQTVVESQIDTIVDEKIEDAISNGATVSSISYGGF